MRIVGLVVSQKPRKAKGGVSENASKTPTPKAEPKKTTNK